MRHYKIGSQFVICIKNKNYPASLETRKIYPVLPDAKTLAHNQIRIIDESGEDYLYPSEYFVPLKLPHAAEKVFSIAK